MQLSVDFNRDPVDEAKLIQRDPADINAGAAVSNQEIACFDPLQFISGGCVPYEDWPATGNIAARDYRAAITV